MNKVVELNLQVDILPFVNVGLYLGRSDGYLDCVIDNMRLRCVASFFKSGDIRMENRKRVGLADRNNADIN